MLEKDLEKIGVKFAKTFGQIQYKFTSLNYTSVPDRLHLAFVPPHYREIVAQFVRFVEYKAEGQRPTARQLKEHKNLESMGFKVEVVDNVEDAERVTLEMGSAEL